MPKTSQLLTLAGSALTLLGGAVLVAALIAPQAVPVLTVTFSFAHLRTPTPAYLGTPLPPPAGHLAGQAIPFVLPVMPVRAAETPTPSPPPTASDTPTVTATVSATPSRTPPPTASRTPERRRTATPMASALPTAMATPTLTVPPTATATPTPSRTPTPTPRSPAPERILIPALGVDAPVQPVGWHTVEIEGQTFGQWDVPQGYAAGWHNTSAPPGQPGNTVLNGHHNIEGQVFGRLIDLTPGDAVILVGGGRRFHYMVAQIMVLQERWRTPQERLENARWTLPSQDERLTLVTCWPQTGNSHRLIVVAVPADPH
mgnify:CR=1 FL=1